MQPLFYMSALVPVIGFILNYTFPLPLIYSLFVLTVILRSKHIYTTQNFRSTRFTLLFMLLSLGILELFSWLTNFVSCAPNPSLLHPQLFWDLVLGMFFYGGLCIGWLLVRKLIALTPRFMFVVGGLYGVLIEGNGSVFLTGLTTLPLGLVLLVFLFLVYGSTAGAIGSLALPHLSVKNLTVKNLLLALFILFLCSSLVIISGSLILSIFGLPPAPRDICTSPLW